jgi:hypothetical protein
MKVDSENIVPSSMVSVSPIFTFSFSFSWGENYKQRLMSGESFWSVGNDILGRYRA